MKKSILVLVVMMVLLSGCGGTPSLGTQKTDQGLYVDKQIDLNLYFLEMEVHDDTLSHSRLGGSFGGVVVGGFGSMGGRIWQDGKGLLRGKLLALDKPVTFTEIGDELIVKTTDLKIMSVNDGEKVKLVCTLDFEPVCAVNEYGGNDTGKCYNLWEFDFCRMISFEPNE